jgi:peptidoglycan/LPS O-acetylase OafA/YrhL
MRLVQGPRENFEGAAGGKSSDQHIRLLDYTRGVAILAVLIFHTLGMAFGYDALPWKGWWRDFAGQTSFLYFLPVGMISQAGVAIFFVVSGFCIHVSFQRQGQQWAGFFVRRFFRIYPPYLLALIFSVLVVATNPGVDFSSEDFWTQLLAHVCLVHNLHPATIYGFNAALWSMAVEAQLYLLYPVLLLLAGRIGWRRAMIGLAACEVAIRGLDGWVQTSGAGNTIGGQVSWVLANSPLGYWFSWALGAFIADAWLKKQPLPFRKASPLLWLGLALGCYFAKPLCVFQFLLFALATAVIVGKRLGRVLAAVKPPAFSLAILKQIGFWSYSIYLLHQPLFHVYSHVIIWAVPSEDRPAPVSFALVVVTWLAVIPFSFFWYELVELPGIALGRRINRRLAGQSPRAVSAPANRTARYALLAAGLAVCVAGSLWISDRFSVRTAMRNCERAWTLATSPDAAKRNGALAVKLAEDACLQTQYRQPVAVGTLAAAYAEAGRFDEAIGAAQAACAMASQAGDRKLLQKYQTTLASYQQHKPYREAAGSTNE